MITPLSPIENLSKLSKPQSAALKNLNVLTIRDLLLYFPYRHADFSQTRSIIDIKPGEAISIKAKVTSIANRFGFGGRMPAAEALISDGTGSLKVIWFNQPYLASRLEKGEELFLAGSPDIYKNTLQLINPIYEKASEFPIHTSRLVPIYRLKKGMYAKTFRNLIAKALPLSKNLEDELPKKILQNLQLPDIYQTVNISHFPKSQDELFMAKKRLAFEEIFINQLLIQKHKLEVLRKKAFAIKFEQELTKTFVDSLPFKLTEGQRQCAWQILQDMEKSVPMNRLLEGDVGSGKTLVALMAALQVVSGQKQAVLLAPTEILARQHYATASKYYKALKIGGHKPAVALLTNSLSEINGQQVSKSNLLGMIEMGSPGLFIGTHALIQDKVKFSSLALVIIDEQHRFGVEQRSQLIKNSKVVPHLLSLTATPIPRTLQLAFYGELDICQIKTKPQDRKDIITKLVAPEGRNAAYAFIKNQIAQGRQAFVITPLIEEDESGERKSAKAEAENLKKIFPGLSIGLLHGKMKTAEKEKVMSDFLERKIDILTSTSVVEVGVDVPNASVMVIEGSERFGLAQLHQFRGRVGRAGHQSYCYLFTDKQDEAVNLRLNEFCRTQDGFALAELDLKKRGFGELYGAEQSGWNFKYFDKDYIALIKPAGEEARKILSVDEDLKKYPLLRERIKGKVVHFE